jgi:transcriptional regulator with XRE-family HTH domain
MRDNLDLSQREIAEKLNVSKSTYARWETGEKIIPLEHLIDFCNLTKTNVDYAIGLSDKKVKLSNNIVINKTTIGNKLKELRLKNNLSQKAFAESINTVQSVISAYETGKTLIQTSFLYDICVKYNISSSLFL